MKIKLVEIETTCKENIGRVTAYLERFCIDNFQEFELFIDGKLVHKQKK